MTPLLVWLALVVIINVLGRIHLLRSAGFGKSAERAAVEQGLLSADGRVAILFAGPAGQRAVRRTRLLEYRGGEVAVQRLVDGSDPIVGVFVSATTRYRRVAPFVSVTISQIIDGQARTTTLSGHALPEAAKRLSGLNI